MHYSIYQYLKTSLRTALEKAFPEQYHLLSSIPITFSSITPDPLTDIATPYPLKISQFLRQPVAVVSEHLLNHFQINTDYLSNTINNIPNKGFFNFRLSSTFLLRSVYEAAITNYTLKTAAAANKPEIISKIELLLKKNEPESLPSLDNFIKMSLPHSTAEHQASRCIAISCNDGIHSAETCEYFKRQLLHEANNCYRMCPVQTDDTQLSVMNYCILKALYIRIIQMTYNVSATDV